MSAALPTQTYIDGVLAGDRRLIAKTITLLESRRADHARQGQEVLEALAGRSGGAVRVGITGAPGVGKSSFIETLGLALIERGHRLAVLAVDPSSPLSHGSILGDKTRMQRLATSEAAYIRPSAAGGTLGGVAHRTREAILVFEAAGYDIVIVETVGVGQSEAEVASMVDFFCVLLQPGAGDELQGIKKGVIELADAIVVNKADGDAIPAAEATCADYTGALSLLRARSAHWTPRVQTASAHSGSGLETFWETVLSHRAALDRAGELARRRSQQARAWLWRLLGDGLERAFRDDPAVAARLEKLEAEVADGTLPAPSAARELLDAFRGGAAG